MARDVTAAQLAELAATSKTPVLFYQGEFASGDLRLWSGVGDKTWAGYTWTGAGVLLGISPVKEAASIVANGIQVTLSGMPSSVIAKVHDEARPNKLGRVWLGFLDATGAVVADPVKSFEGRLDVPEVVDGGETCTITVSYESRLIDLRRPRLWRWDHATQQQHYPGDLGFQYVADLQDQVIEW
jgi:hypothetical protein